MNGELTILTWNILHGGGPQRVPEITLALLEHRADIIVLTEFRQQRGGQIRAVLSEHGLEHQRASPAAPDRNSVLIASRWPLRAGDTESPAAPSPTRWVEAFVVGPDVTVVGVHVPDDTQKAPKAAMWRHLVGFASRHEEKPCVVAGDFNTYRPGQDGGAPSACQALLGAFSTHGFSDAWRRLNPGKREASWRSHLGQELRLDAVYLSKPLHETLQTAAYSHVEREQGISDHSVLAVRLGLKTTGFGPRKQDAGGLFRPTQADDF
jgi:exodeoxyribonuclease-3